MFSLIIYILFSSINNEITKQKIQDNCLYQVHVYSYWDKHVIVHLPESVFIS